ncbi:MAG: RNA polymerase sigma factor [Bryobacteraceae bacterium]
MGTTTEFESAALPHRDEILRAALAMMRNRGDAEDLTQEVYLVAWKSFHRFEAGTNCRAWLFRILLHRLWKRRRTSGRMIFADLDEYPFKNLQAPESVPGTLTDRRLIEALERLPQSYREVLRLSHLQELSYREIAGHLNVPLGTVMSRLSRGRAILREQLGAVAESFGIHASSPMLESPR